MAITLIGSRTITMQSRTIQKFPLVNLKKNKGFLFVLDTTPLNLTVDYGYLLIIPTQTLDGLAYERPKHVKWFPKGSRFAFKYSTLENFGDPVPTQIGLYPVELFSGRATPATFTANLYWENGEEEPPSVMV
jgi:hypothetical protein